MGVKNMKKGALIAGAIVVIVLAAGCQARRSHTTPAKGKVITDSRSVQSEGAKSAVVRLQLNTADLELSGGGKGLMDADFRYRDPTMKPEIEYAISDGKGSMAVRQPYPGRGTRDDTSDWNVRLGDRIPVHLSIGAGEGDTDLDLGTVNVTSLDVTPPSLDTGWRSGDIRVDLSGNHPYFAGAGLGSNSGDIHIRMTGSYPHTTQLRADSSSGDVTADLSGTWGRDANVDIATDAGDVSIRLPQDIGVFVTATTGVGRVEATSLKRYGKAYVNEAFGSSRVTMYVLIKVGIGSIRLELAN